MNTKGLFPGWRTMTKSQRYNAKMFKLFEDAKRLKEQYKTQYKD